VTQRRTALAWAASVVAALVLVLAVPYHLTDGDSCLYSALAHDMARGGSWVASTWDFHGAPACFHEHPPGTFWVSAVIEWLGAPRERASLAANALWTFAALSGVFALARRFVTPRTALAAGVVFLLHLEVLRYAQRAALEIPLAAAGSWAIAAGLRLDRSRWWSVVAAVALAAAFLVRGVLAAAPVAVLIYALLDRPVRPPVLRLGAAFAGAALLLLAFDRAHAAATGHGFWIEYLRRQVVPSFEAGGTRHSVPGETWPYFVSRALAYSLPWSVLPVWRMVNRPPPLPSPAAWRLALVWIVVTVAGVSLGSRPGSRYVLQMFAATALLAALAAPPDLSDRTARIVAVVALAFVPVQVLVKDLVHDRGPWWDTAAVLEERRGDARIAGRELLGPFLPEDDHMKSFLRFHLGTSVSSAPVGEMRGLQWVPGAGADFPVGRVLAATPLGAVVDYER